MIIDAHSHLGDILNEGGADLIYRENVVMERMWDPQALNEKQLNRSFGLGALAYKATEYWATKAQRARNFTATLQNMQRSLDEAGVDFTVCLPIAPYVTFEDLARAKEHDGRIIPFTSVDFSREHDIAARLSSDFRRGSMGLKLHPIIQRVPLDDSRTREALNACESHNRPVLIHGGVSGYYLGREKCRNTPEFGKIIHIEKAVQNHPDVNFIIGHAGLFQVHELCRRLKGLSNVWVDTSFQSPGTISKLLKVLGRDKVMYASDWPFGNRPPHLKTVEIACRGDSGLREKLFFRNACTVLRLPQGINS